MNENELIELAQFVIKSNFSLKLKRETLGLVCWKFSELNGKYDGVKYWSKNAKKLRENNTKTKKYFSGLRHEHVVPKKVLIEKLLSDYFNKSIKEIRNFFRDFCFAAIITKEEDNKYLKKYKQEMPIEFNWKKDQVWLRYEKTGLYKNIVK